MITEGQPYKRNQLSAYKLVRFIDPERMLAEFRETEDGPIEIFARRPEGHAGWGLRFDGSDWEFCSSRRE